MDKIQEKKIASQSEHMAKTMQTLFLVLLIEHQV